MERPPEIDGGVDLSQLGKVPTAGTIVFEVIQYRFGFMLENEEKVGVTIQFWFAPLPWFKFQLPFGTNYLAKFVTDLNEMYQEILEDKKR